MGAEGRAIETDTGGVGLDQVADRLGRQPPGRLTREQRRALELLAGDALSTTYDLLRACPWVCELLFAHHTRGAGSPV